MDRHGESRGTVRVVMRAPNESMSQWMKTVRAAERPPHGARSDARPQRTSIRLVRCETSTEKQQTAADWLRYCARSDARPQRTLDLK